MSGRFYVPQADANGTPGDSMGWLRSFRQFEFWRRKTGRRDIALTDVYMIHHARENAGWPD